MKTYMKPEVVVMKGVAPELMGASKFTHDNDAKSNNLWADKNTDIWGTWNTDNGTGDGVSGIWNNNGSPWGD